VSETEDEYGFVTPAEFIYHNYTTLEKKLLLLEQTYPNLTRVYSIGKSVKGKNLYVIEISDRPGHHEPGNKCSCSLANLLRRIGLSA
jgi:carboxypeptidase D